MPCAVAGSLKNAASPTSAQPRPARARIWPGAPGYRRRRSAGARVQSARSGSNCPMTSRRPPSASVATRPLKSENAMQAVVGRNCSPGDAGSEVPMVSLARYAGKIAVDGPCAVRRRGQQLCAHQLRNPRCATVGADHQIGMDEARRPVLPAHRRADDPTGRVEARLDRGRKRQIGAGRHGGVQKCAVEQPASRSA